MDFRFIADILYPIIPVEEDLNFYCNIVENKLKLIEQERWNKVIGRRTEPKTTNINFEELFKARRTENKFYSEDTFYMEDFWFHGMSTCIAEIMNTSRQNIDRYVSLGKVKESRTMDKAIYDFLGEKIW